MGDNGTISGGARENQGQAWCMHHVSAARQGESQGRRQKTDQAAWNERGCRMMAGCQKKKSGRRGELEIVLNWNTSAAKPWNLLSQPPIGFEPTTFCLLSRCSAK